mmetsp:Transcript_15118/g.33341  ORF Transcript_15118/g.33341 Transcript_15118/m.33341 type:complete len:339 (-) Transcript_15118:413-1429(-)
MKCYNELKCFTGTDPCSIGQIKQACAGAVGRAVQPATSARSENRGSLPHYMLSLFAFLSLSAAAAAANDLLEFVLLLVEIILIVGALVLLDSAGGADLHNHAHDQVEPKDMQKLQREQQHHEGPANGPTASEVPVSLRGHAPENVARVQHQPRHEERHCEEAEDAVDYGREPLAALGLGDVVEPLPRLEEHVRHVVQQQDHRTDAREVVQEGDGDQRDGDQVVQDHLKGVGARDLRPEELVHVATQLHLVVQSHCGGDWVVGPAHEELQCLVDPGRSGGHKQRVVAERAEAGVEDESPGGLYVLHDLGVRDPVSPPRPQVPLHVQLLAARARAVGLDL